MAGGARAHYLQRACRVGEEERADPVLLIERRVADQGDVDRLPPRPPVVEWHGGGGALEAGVALGPLEDGHRDLAPSAGGRRKDEAGGRDAGGDDRRDDAPAGTEGIRCTHPVTIPEWPTALMESTW